MSGTLETTNNLILIKIKSLRDVASIIYKCDIIPKIKISDIISDLQEISNDYEMGSIKILSDYFLLMHNYQASQADQTDELNQINKANANNLKNTYLSNNDKYYAKYQTFIKKENFVGKIDRYYKTLKNMIPILKNQPKSQPKSQSKSQIKDFISQIKSIFSVYENSTIVHTIHNNVYNKCNKCAREMKIIANLSEIVCSFCGITETLYGTVFEDEQFYYQEGQRSKHGSYDPSKHCRFWIERIQAKESKEIPDKVLEAVKKCIRYNNIRNKEDITCKEIRKYLSQTRNSSYNEHIPLIRKIITGESPAQLTDQELLSITVYFDKVIRIYEDIKPITKTNVPYHPYLIYKIIEHILVKKKPKDFQESKKRIMSILSCIHLQSRETLIENDKTWKEICEYIEEIEYSPTDRNDQYEDD